MKILNASTLGYIFIAGAVLVAASPALARECMQGCCWGGYYATRIKTEKVFVPSKMDCAKDTSSFADFSNGCNYTAAHYKDIETTYREWVPEQCHYSQENGNFGNR